jgi:phosphocarrier protein FPr
MSAEFAVELLADASGPVMLSDAPLVEGAVAAAVAARGGAPLAEVAAQARGALAMKVSQLDASASESDDSSPSEPPADGPPTGSVAADAEASLPVRNEIGLHARPAARMVEIAGRFDAEVRVAKASGGQPVRASSLTNVVALGARFGDTLLVSAVGPQAGEAIDALTALANEGFGDGIAEAAAEPARPEPAKSPAVVESAPAAVEPPAAGAVLTGVPASTGIALGGARQLRSGSQPPPPATAQGPERERARLEQGIATAREKILRDRETVAARASQAEAEIFDAHLALLDDEAMLDPAEQAIGAGTPAEHAWHDAAQRVAARYRGLDSALLRERAADVLDVGRRVVGALTDERDSIADHAGIVVAGELTPADTAGLDPARVLGIATAHGTATAHAAILARGLGLPCVVGLGDAVLGIPDGTQLLLDGEAGTLLIDPPEDVVREADTRRRRAQERRVVARARAHEPGVTRDGTRVEVFANLGATGEAARAVELGAEGVGLLRTEFLFLDRPELPSVDEQTETLREIAVALDGRPLIVRTLDAGADKPLPALPMPTEANPFLGVRGIRMVLERPEILERQFSAILRVAAEHPVKAMLPMVSTAQEIRAARELLEQARVLTAVEVPLELGIMVEVPAAALTAMRLAEEADFFSLGTNDLTQYTMAAERGNERLASLLTGPQPAVLKLVQATVRAAARRGRFVGVCGELAGDPASALLLVGLGVTELSMAPGLVPEVKAALREVDLATARITAQAALQAEDAAAARALGLALL